MVARKWVFALGSLVLAGAALPVALQAQDPAASVAEAARRSREQKKKTTKPATVVTDDALQHSSSAPTTPAQESAQSSPASAPDTPATQDSKQTSGDATDKENADKEKRKKAEIEALKQKIAEQKESVKLAQREIALQQDTFYSNPDYAHDKAGQDKLAALKAELQQKQDALADLQSKLTALGGTEDPAPASSKP